MKAPITLFSLLFVFILGSSFTTLDTPVKKWQKLGSKKVNYSLDKDVIRVGANDGTFTKLKIKVKGGSVNMHKMVVEYGNGSKDKIPLKHTFTRGTDSRVIDLEGGRRVIKDITFWYDTKNFARKKATVIVYGK